MPISVDPAVPNRAPLPDDDPGGPGDPVVTMLRRVCVFIPSVMVAISACILALRHLHPAGLAWALDNSYFSNNISILRDIRHLAGDDSWTPMLAVRDWLQRHPGGDAYDYFFFDMGTKFQYPLSSLLAIQWLPLQGRDAVHALNLLSLAAWFSIFPGMVLLNLRLARMFAVRTAAPGPSARTVWIGAASLLTTLCFYPLIRGVYLGQIQVLLDALFVFACYFYASRRSGLAGVLLGLSALVKPQMALFLLWGLLRRDRAFVTGLAACAGAGYVASGLLYGWSWPQSYLRVLSFIGRHGESFYANQSMNGLVNRLLGNGTNLIWEYHRFAPYDGVTYALTLLSTGLLLAGGLWSTRAAVTPRAATASLMVAGLCFTAASPVAWEHHYGILLPIFSLLFFSLLEIPDASDRRRRWLLLGATFVTVANVLSPLNLLATTRFNILQSYEFFAVLGVLLLVFLSRRDLGWSVGHRRAPHPQAFPGLTDVSWR